MKKLLLILFLLAFGVSASVQSYIDSIGSFVHFEFNDNLIDRISGDTGASGGAGTAISYDSSDIAANGMRVVLPGSRSLNMGTRPEFNRNGATTMVVGMRCYFDTIISNQAYGLFNIRTTGGVYIDCLIYINSLTIAINSQSIFASRNAAGLGIVQKKPIDIIIYLNLTSSNECLVFVNGLSTFEMTWNGNNIPDTLPNLAGGVLEIGRSRLLAGVPAYPRLRIDEFFIANNLTEINDIFFWHQAAVDADLYVAMGQSNGMVMRADTLQGMTKSSDSIWIFDRVGTSFSLLKNASSRGSNNRSMYPVLGNELSRATGKEVLFLAGSVGGTYLYHTDTASWVGSFDTTNYRDSTTYLGKTLDLVHRSNIADQVRGVIVRNGEEDLQSVNSTNQYVQRMIELQNHIKRFIADIPMFFGLGGLTSNESLNDRIGKFRVDQLTLHNPAQNRIICTNPLVFSDSDGVHTNWVGQEYAGRQTARTILLYNADSGSMVSPFKSLSMALQGRKLTIDLDTALRASSGFEILSGGSWSASTPDTSGDTLTFTSGDSVRYLWGSRPDTTNYLYDTAYGLRWAALPFTGAFPIAISSIRVDSSGVWNGLYLKGRFAVTVDSVKIDSVLVTDIVQTDSTTLQFIPATPLVWRKTPYQVVMYSEEGGFSYDFKLMKSGSGSIMFFTNPLGIGF